jgi:hypothetical protein
MVEDGHVVDVEVRVAVEHPADRPQERHRPLQRAARPEQAVAVERVAYLNAEARAVPDMLDDLLAEVPQAEDDLADAVPMEQGKLMVDERAIGDGDECLGEIGGERA